jgi:hypothetical protein
MKHNGELTIDPLRYVSKLSFDPMNHPPKINTMLIGADRSGSSWIHFLCSQHPDIFCVPGNQISFYSNEYSKGIFRSPKINWDRTGWNNEPIILGRRNIKVEHGHAIPKLLHAENSNIKFLYIIRNPIDRCYSTFTNQSRHFQNQTFDINIDKNFKKCRIEYSYHFKQLKYYFKYFSRENFYFLISEQASEEPQLWLNNLFSFLGIQSDLTLKYLDKHMNKRTEQKKYRVNNYIPPTTEFKQKITNLCREDTKIMSEILGIDLMKIWKLDEY